MIDPSLRCAWRGLPTLLFFVPDEHLQVSFWDPCPVLLLWWTLRSFLQFFLIVSFTNVSFLSPILRTEKNIKCFLNFWAKQLQIKTQTLLKDPNWARRRGAGNRKQREQLIGCKETGHTAVLTCDTQVKHRWLITKRGRGNSSSRRKCKV